MSITGAYSQLLTHHHCSPQRHLLTGPFLPVNTLLVKLYDYRGGIDMQNYADNN